MGKASREKGARVERLLVDLLQRVWPAARRSCNQSHGASDPDVKGSPFWTESKGGKSPGLWAALRQALGDRAAAGQSRRPILLYLRRDRTPPVVVLLADEWIEREAMAKDAVDVLALLTKRGPNVD